MQLKIKNNNEIIGHLTDVKILDDMQIITFTMQYEVMVPSTAISTEELKELIGVRIGLLHIDGNFKVRKITK